ncbi:hypothetical protein [Plantactinospora sp. KBS50]|uniref:hypothetical protein n=1 Tax=Plantactinospora sp. KBS50 TaxID=2024580 RepID=UPI000BAAF60F|nr:hypothetical protein [Plantactinospora sp. KBS50]ASW56218.1 hypothetical protein CIK06_21745 [Plantactinospora sp. KBS50]
MRGKLLFIGGLATGFVLGARAGREKYEELVLRGRKVLDHPTVQEAAGVAQAQANRLYAEGKDRLSQTKLGEKFAAGNDTTTELTSADRAFAGTPAGTSTTGSTGTPGSTGSRGKTSSGGAGTNGSTL